MPAAGACLLRAQLYDESFDSVVEEVSQDVSPIELIEFLLIDRSPRRKSGRSRRIQKLTLSMESLSPLGIQRYLTTSKMISMRSGSRPDTRSSRFHYISASLVSGISILRR